MQVEAERRKRAAILESEGQRDAEINRAEGIKQSQILSSEGKLIETVNRAEGKEFGGIYRRYLWTSVICIFYFLR